METTEKDRLRHELIGFRQMFHSYSVLAKNDGFHISPKKISEICHKCALRIDEVCQKLLEEI